MPLRREDLFPREGERFPGQRDTEPGGRDRPVDLREALDGSNIVELFPDAVMLHCRDDSYTVTPGATNPQNFTVGNWLLPYDAFLFAIYVELINPDVAQCARSFLRVTHTINNESQVQSLVARFDDFLFQISCRQGVTKSHFRPLQPYGRRIQKGERLYATLQVQTTAGAGFDVEFDVQCYVLNLERMRTSGR